MSKGIYVALSGAIAQETALETTATNVSNASTPGYQRLRPMFREALAKAKNPDPNLRYASAPTTAVDTAPGALRSTGRGLDVALPKGVYLGIQTERGERFTRAGNLMVDETGMLKTASGLPVLGESGSPVQFAAGPGEPRIDNDGNCTQGNSVVGRLRLVRFSAPDKLQHEGNGMMAAGGAGTPEATKERIESGSLEESNGTVVTAMTDLMSASRTFEAFQKILETMGEVDRKVLTVPTGID